jgi:hypothetical protein
MVNEYDVNNYFNQSGNTAQDLVNQYKQGGSTQENKFNLPPEVYNTIVKEVVNQIMPSIIYALSSMGHGIVYSNVKSQFKDLKPEDFIKLVDEVEKELGNSNISKVEEFLDRLYNRNVKIIEKLSNKSKDNKEKPEEKATDKTDANTNKGVVKTTVTAVENINLQPLIGNEAATSQQNTGNEDPVKKVFMRLQNFRKMPMLNNNLVNK